MIRSKSPVRTKLRPFSAGQFRKLSDPGNRLRPAIRVGTPGNSAWVFGDFFLWGFTGALDRCSAAPGAVGRSHGTEQRLVDVPKRFMRDRLPR